MEKDENKRGRGRPRTNTTEICLCLHPDLLQKLDNLRRAEPDLPTRPEYIRRLIREA